MLRHTTPPRTARSVEERRLNTEAQGKFAPAKPGFFADKRAGLIARDVEQGLRKFDEQQAQAARSNS